MIVRIAGGVVAGIIAVIGVICSLIPFVIAAGFSLSSLDDFPEGFARAVEQNLPSLIAGGVVSIVLMTLAVTVAVAIWSFVEAGTIGIWADGERAAPAQAKTAGFATFTLDAWMAHGRAAWWPIFWIYNIIWGVATLVLIVPLAILAVPVILWKENPVTWIGGCAGLVIVLIIFVLVSLIADLWVKMSLAEVVVSRCGAVSSLRRSIRWAKARLGEFFALIGVRIVLSIVLNIPTGIIYFALGGVTSSRETWTAGLIPFQLGLGLLQAIVSVVAACWFQAGLVSLSIPQEGSPPHVDLNR